MFRVPELLTSIEGWVGLILTLMILSLVFRENIFSRLAQYILVGAATGYLAVIAIQNILRPQLFRPIMQQGMTDSTLIVPLILGLLLLGSGTIRIFQGTKTDPNRPESLTRRIIYTIGTFPAAILIGVGLATAIIGAIQGTLLPQFLRAAQIGLTWNGSAPDLVAGIITLLVTIGVFLHLYAMPAHKPASQPVSSIERVELPEQARLTQLQPIQIEDRPSIFVWFISAWAGLGKRALWLAAGVLFARLVASRLSLLIAKFEYIANVLKATQLWQTVLNLLQ